MNFKRWFLAESIFDKHLLKGVILLGGPASGKSKATEYFETAGFQVVQSDIYLTRLLKKAGIPLTNVDKTKIAPLWKKAGTATDAQFQGHLKSMHPIIFESTGSSVNSVKWIKDTMESAGYDVFAVFVDTPTDIALKRNKKRERQIEDAELEKSHDSVRNNMTKYQEMFKDKLYRVDGTGDSREVPEMVQRIIQSKLENPIGRERLGKEILSSQDKGPIHPNTYLNAAMDPPNSEKEFEKDYNPNKLPGRTWTKDTENINNKLK